MSTSPHAQLLRSPNDYSLHSLSNNNVSESTSNETLTACLLFMLIGVGYLYPISALTQPVDYWDAIFPNYDIEFSITLTFMTTNLLCLTLIVFLCTSQDLWYKGRIVGGLIGQLFVLLAISVSSALLEHTNTARNATLLLFVTAIASASTAIIDSAAITLVSHYPPIVQRYFQLGIGMSTLLGSIYRDATKLIVSVDEIDISAQAFFLCGALTTAGCIVALYKVQKLNLTKIYVPSFALSSSLASSDLYQRNEAQSLSDFQYQNRLLTPPKTYKALLKVMHLQLLLGLSLLTTLALWPPLVTEIPTSNFPELSLKGTGWWPLILLTVWSVSDCIGRILVNLRWRWTGDNIWIAIWARVLLIPIIIGIVNGYWFTHELWAIAFVSILGYTNGYFVSMLIILISENLEDHDKEFVGPFTSLFLNTGLVLGSVLGFVLKKFTIASP